MRSHCVENWWKRLWTCPKKDSVKITVNAVFSPNSRQSPCSLVGKAFELIPLSTSFQISITYLQYVSTYAVDCQLHPNKIHKTNGCSSLTRSFSTHVSKPQNHTHNVHPYASRAVPHREPLGVSLENRGKL